MRVLLGEVAQQERCLRAVLAGFGCVDAVSTFGNDQFVDGVALGARGTRISVPVR